MQTIIQKTREDTMYSNDVPVLIYQINYPFFTTTCSTISAQRINSYYAHTSKMTEEYCRSVLYPQAMERATSLQNNQHFYSDTLDVNFKVTYNSGCITSLYSDTYIFLGGAHGETKRTSDTWNFKTGARIQLKDIYPLNTASFYQLQKCIEQQIAERIKESPGSYFEDYSTLLQKNFNSKSFYLQPNGFVIYYQQYDIAPYISGLPEFNLLLCKPFGLHSNFNFPASI